MSNTTETPTESKPAGSRLFARRTILIVLSCALLGVAVAGYFVVFRSSALQSQGSGSGSGSESDPTADLTLSESERAFLWSCENRGNVLNRQGFRRLEKALREADKQQLLKYCASEFQGKMPLATQEVSCESAHLSAVRKGGGTESQPASAEAFAEWLLGFRALFRTEPKVKISLLLLSPLDRAGFKEDWEGTALLRLWGDAEPGKPAEVVLNLKYRISYPSVENLSANGWLKEMSVTQTLVTRSSLPLFRETAREKGIDVDKFSDTWLRPTPHLGGEGVFVCDLNRDNVLDLIFLEGTYGMTIYLGGTDGKFTDATAKYGLASGLVSRDAFGGVIAVADLDADGWDDIISAKGMFRNVGGEKFERVNAPSLSLGPKPVSVTIADYDRDGLLDVYVTNAGKGKADSWIEGRSGYSGNKLFRNKGDWTFEDVTERTNSSGNRRSSFTALWLDIDNDGWLDIYIPNEFGRGLLLLNQQGKRFTERELEGPGDFGTMGATSGDWNNDGFVDLYSANMYSKAGKRVFNNLNQCDHPYPPGDRHKIQQFVAGSQMYRNLGGDVRAKLLEPVGLDFQVNGVGWAYGPAMFDMDNDGFLDLYATAGFCSRDRNEPDG